VAVDINQVRANRFISDNGGFELERISVSKKKGPGTEHDRIGSS
jgi:hypothetical protein